MRFSTIVEKNDETLLELIGALDQFEQNRFIADTLVSGADEYGGSRADEIL